MLLDPKTAAALLATQQNDQHKAQQAALHCQIMATIVAPMVAMRVSMQADRAEWDGSDDSIDIAKELRLANQVAAHLMAGHGLM